LYVELVLSLAVDLVGWDGHGRGMVAAPAGPRVERPPSPLSSVIEIAEVSSVTAVGDGEGETSSALMPLQPDWMEPPESLELTTTVAREETTGAPSSAMLEAFYQFQHNPQIQVQC
jgi:hypothetical protein